MKGYFQLHSLHIAPLGKYKTSLEEKSAENPRNILREIKDRQIRVVTELSLEGTVHPKTITLFPSRLCWCELLSYGDFRHRDV